MKVKVKNEDRKKSLDEYIGKADAIETRLGEEYRSWEKCLIFEVQKLSEIISRIDYSKFIVHDMSNESEFDYSVRIYDYYVE